MLDATYACPDVTTFYRIDDLGLVDRAAARVGPGRRRCRYEGVVRETVVRRLAVRWALEALVLRT